ncbi:MAG: dimethylarginine dimethylaminohydrolase family protein [Candidatus Thorarchaeota archaeon]|jgi:dimethylargininase
MTKRAIVRPPGKSFPSCITSHPERGSIDTKKARKQHAEYCKVLEELGFDLITLPEEDGYPDSCFVEDTAVVLSNKALITRMAMDSRRGEELAIKQVLESNFSIRETEPPAIIEGGDVVKTPDKLICGLTQRTNSHGVEQMESWLDTRVDTILDSTIIHLKSYLTFLGEGYAICTEGLVDHESLDDFVLLVVPEDESYAANTLTLGDTVLMPKGFDNSAEIVNEAGFDVITLDISEFTKCEGALTCLSIIL